MAKKTVVVPDPDEEVTLDDDGEEGTDLDVAGLADRLDADSKSRAVGRILDHHRALRRELDKVCTKAGELAEQVASLESRLAVLEKGDGEEESEPAAAKNGKKKAAKSKVSEEAPAKPAAAAPRGPLDYFFNK
jgi:hypothetical protein